MMHIIFLNGPPRSGKDTIARQLCKYHGFHQIEFKQPLEAAARMLLPISAHGIPYEFLKEMPAYLDGPTFRQLMIEISERAVKPLFGTDYFGRVAAQNILLYMHTQKVVIDKIVVSDSGFVEEAEALIDNLAALIEDISVTLVHLHRKGKSFVGDSRSYIELDGITPIELYNDNTVSDTMRTLFNAMKIGH